MKMNGQKTSISVVGDGNCLFRCLSYFIFSTQKFHYLIRLIIVKFIHDHWDNFKEFICGEGVYDIQISNNEDYYNHLSKQRIYGGEVEIAAFLHIFPNIKIVIHQDNRPPVVHGNTTSNFQLILKLSGVVDSGHYDIIQCYNENYEVENIEDLKHSALDTKKHFDANKKRQYHKEYMRKYRMKSNQQERNIQIDTNETPRQKKTIYMREYMRKKRAEQKKKIEVEKLNISSDTDENIHLNPIDYNNLNQSMNVKDLHREISNDENDSEEHHENSQTAQNNENILSNEIPISTNNKYSNYNDHTSAHKYFDKEFTKNSFGYACSICDRLWFQNDLKTIPKSSDEIIKTIIPKIDIDSIRVCSTCKQSILKNKIPTMSIYNGFKFIDKPSNLPKLNPISERLISPRIPFMQIRRLRHGQGQYGILGQIINVPVEINTMVNCLPRNIDDDHCINVHLKKRQIHKSSYLIGFVKKNDIKLWLDYLKNTPLYKYYDIKVDDAFFSKDNVLTDNPNHQLLEDVPIEESLLAQQKTLQWDDEQYLRIAPGENNIPHSLLFDEHAEELSFPSIYLGHFRTFSDEITVSPFMIATSEIRRSDRRAVEPNHLLYIAVKILRLRLRDSLKVAFKNIGTNSKITRQQIESEEYVNNCLESNLAFLRCIPNSAWYWSQRKKDLFAMIRQLGKPTVFLTISANEIGWSDLLQTLYKLKNGGGSISEKDLADMHFIEKTTLINEDAVTCAIYFNKLVNILLNILQSKTFSPFGKYRVKFYFKRIEFQQRGSPHAHILLWLDNAPENAMEEGMSDAITLIDHLITVSESESSDNIKLQTHRHTFTCYKKVKSNNKSTCRFEAPFLPVKETIILKPMQKEEEGYANYSKQYKTLRSNLESNDYQNFEDYYKSNGILSDDHYINIIRAGINRPRVFLKRDTTEKWINPFNAFIFNKTKSNMDIQFITEEYSCAQYVAEYVNKTDRGISNLQREISHVMDEYPEFDIIEVARKLGIKMLNSVEMSSQEAAWYLLREPMCKCSIKVIFIPTMWPQDRHRIKKTKEELDKINVDAESVDIWKENCFDKYQNRPESLDNITLAQFVSKYYLNKKGEYVERKHKHIIRYRHFDMGTDLNEYKREMVTLHFPFKDEDEDILQESKYITIYNENEATILERRKEFELDLDISKTIEICRKLCRDSEFENETQPENIANVLPQNNDQAIFNGGDPVNEDLFFASINKLGPIAKKKENLMENENFWKLMQSANKKQLSLLLHFIYKNLSGDKEPLQLFFTGAAGCGKTYVIKLLMEIYNRYTDTDGHCNAYITCASTGKAAVAINGTTVHTALKISLCKLLPLSYEVLAQYRTLFKYVKVIIIDEVSMISAELLHKIDKRLKEITGNYEVNYGNLDIILIGDLRQLPPVRATAIFKPIKGNLDTRIDLWRNLKFYKLDEVMRQDNKIFSNLLTKIGDGIKLDEEELKIIESRFFDTDDVNRLCPNGVRLFFKNDTVTQYNNSVLTKSSNKVISKAIDIYINCHSDEQQNFLRDKVHKKSTIDTGGLPEEIIFVENKNYIITTNIDVSDGLANGAVGKLSHIEYTSDQTVNRVWLLFPDKKTGEKLRKKCSSYIIKNNLDKLAVPIIQRTASIPLNNNKTILLKRCHFPLVPANAMTIHKSQGGTFDEIVYEYEKSQDQQLVYVALSRATTLEKLFIVTPNNDFKFYHGRRNTPSTLAVRKELERLETKSLITIDQHIVDMIKEAEGLSIYTFNCQSLRAHKLDLKDQVLQNCDILLLSETWMNDDENIEIPNFRCVIKYKRPQRRAGGVAIFQKNSDSNNTLELTDNNHSSPYDAENLERSQELSVGDLCAVICTTAKQLSIIIISIYIYPKQKINEIIEFIFNKLLIYTIPHASEAKSEKDKIPMILAGDFNVNFSDKSSEPLISFLYDKLQLKINNDIHISTTRYGTCLDAVFSRHLNSLRSEVFASYFSYHKPIISILPNKNDSADKDI